MTLVCPDCKRSMEVEDRGADGVRVVLTGTTPPAPCCQKAATTDHSCVGMFVTGG
jgi:hypothetical protein